MSVELDLGRISHFTIDKRDSHGFCVVIRVYWVYCVFRVLGFSRDTKY